MNIIFEHPDNKNGRNCLKKWDDHNNYLKNHNVHVVINKEVVDCRITTVFGADRLFKTMIGLNLEGFKSFIEECESSNLT